MKTISILVLIVVNFCLLQTAQAFDAPWFEIEILVFEQSSQNRLDSEQWDQQITLPDTETTKNFITLDPSVETLDQLCLQGKIIPVMELISVTEVVDEIELEVITDTTNTEISIQQAETAQLENLPEEQPFIILDPELNQLNELKTSLRRRRGYRPMLHISWRQPVEGKKNSQLIRLFAGENYSETFNPQGDARVNIASQNKILTPAFKASSWGNSELGSLVII